MLHVPVPVPYTDIIYMPYIHTDISHINKCGWRHALRSEWPFIIIIIINTITIFLQTYITYDGILSCNSEQGEESVLPLPSSATVAPPFYPLDPFVHTGMRHVSRHSHDFFYRCRPCICPPTSHTHTCKRTPNMLTHAPPNITPQLYVGHCSKALCMCGSPAPACNSLQSTTPHTCYCLPLRLENLLRPGSGPEVQIQALQRVHR